MSFGIANFTSIGQHIGNVSPYQLTDPATFISLVLALVSFFLVGVVIRHSIAVAVAMAVLVILLSVGTGLAVGNFQSVFTTVWSLFAPLATALATLFFSSGIYSLIASVAGFMLGYFVTRA